MAKQIDPPGADGIDVTVSIEILDPHTVARPDGNRWQVLVILHLGAGVPEHLQIPSDQGGVAHQHKIQDTPECVQAITRGPLAGKFRGPGRVLRGMRYLHKEGGRLF